MAPKNTATNDEKKALGLQLKQIISKKIESTYALPVPPAAIHLQRRSSVVSIADISTSANPSTVKIRYAFSASSPSYASHADLFGRHKNGHWNWPIAELRAMPDLFANDKLVVTAEKLDDGDDSKVNAVRGGKTTTPKVKEEENIIVGEGQKKQKPRHGADKAMADELFSVVSKEEKDTEESLIETTSVKKRLRSCGPIGKVSLLGGGGNSESKGSIKKTVSFSDGIAAGRVEKRGSVKFKVLAGRVGGQARRVLQSRQDLVNRANDVLRKRQQQKDAVIAFLKAEEEKLDQQLERVLSLKAKLIKREV